MKLCTLQVSAPQAYQNKPHNPDSRIKDNFPANETHKTGKKKAIEININEKPSMKNGSKYTIKKTMQGDKFLSHPHTF